MRWLELPLLDEFDAMMMILSWFCRFGSVCLRSYLQLMGSSRGKFLRFELQQHLQLNNFMLYDVRLVGQFQTKWRGKYVQVPLFTFHALKRLAKMPEGVLHWAGFVLFPSPAAFFHSCNCTSNYFTFGCWHSVSSTIGFPFIIVRCEHVSMFARLSHRASQW